MMCYKDVTYCDTPTNKCLNKDCSRHQETNYENFRLIHNANDLPISVSDFSNGCEDFKNGK